MLRIICKKNVLHEHIKIRNVVIIRWLNVISLYGFMINFVIRFIQAVRERTRIHKRKNGSLEQTHLLQLCLYINGGEGVYKSLPDQEGNKLQRPNSGFIQHTPHVAQYTS
jgi:hypothetical protein